MADMTKMPKGMKGKPPVRQIKGPGMNMGLPKRHKMAAPKPYNPPRGSKKNAKSGSLLPEGMYSAGGKVISSTNC